MTKFLPPLLVALALTLFASRSSWAQGSLTPVGAPAPTFKTLQQVEPRTTITNAGAVTISASGSYYLTTNITVAMGDAITITANGVTLDLNGFTISSTEASPAGTGVLIVGNDITILNGHIRGKVTNSGGVFSGSGFANGINRTGFPFNIRVAGVSVSGCLLYGINLYDSISNVVGCSVVESCTVRTVGFDGILANTISHSVAFPCGGIAILGDAVSDCYGQSTSDYGVNATSANNCTGVCDGSGDGLHVEMANNCYGASSNGVGLIAEQVDNSVGVSTGSIGLSAYNVNNSAGYSYGSGVGLYADYTANNCHGRSSSGTGLSASIANNCYGSSTTGTGLYAYRIATSCVGFTGSAGAKAALDCDGTANACTGENAGGGAAIKAVIGIGCMKFGGTNIIIKPFLGTVSP